MQKQAKYLIDNYCFGANGISSSWDYDNRYDSAFGDAFPRSIVNHAVGGPVFMKRDFQVQKNGKMVLEALYEVSNCADGVFIEITSSDKKALFELKTEGGKYIFNGIITDEPATTGIVRLKVILHLDNKSAKFVLNGKTVGIYKLYDFEDAATLIIGTDGTTDVTVTPHLVQLYIDYIANESFLGTSKYFPEEWKIHGNYELSEYSPTSYTYAKTVLKAGETSFAVLPIEKTNGNIVLEGYFLLPEGADGACFSLKSNGEEAFAVYSENSEFKTGDGTSLRNFTPNVWQLIRFETDGKNILVKIDGKKCGTFKSKSSSFDEISITFVPEIDATLCFSDIKCEYLIDYPDYCPKPEPVRHPEFEVGMNMCSMWREGHHFGWDRITHFKENTPLIGPYDEGSPEVADWEIKFMVEHGLTFQHYCWYCPDPKIDRPMKRSRMDHALRDGFMNARYSDMMKFAIMWENAGYNNTSTDDFKEFIWKYWCDYFFTDDRYLVIDNKPLLTIWCTRFLEYWGEEKTAEMLEFMNEDIKRYGFDGMWFMSATWIHNYPLLSKFFDVTYAYHYLEGGSSAEHQINCIDTCNKYHEEQGMASFMNSISVGYNTCAWHGPEERCPLISLEGFEKVLRFAKNHGESADGSNPFDKYFMISTWNEYGEGTYAMPSHLHGFGYLDKIREVFVPESGKCENLLPDENQRKRITYLNVDGRRLIRRYGTEQSEEYVVSDNNIFNSIDFKNDTNFDNVLPFINTKLIYNDNSVRVIPDGHHEHYSLLVSDRNGLFTHEQVSCVRVRIRTEHFALIRLAFLTDTDQRWASNKAEISKAVTGVTGWTDVFYNVSRFPSWNGRITDVRVDNMVGTEFEIARIDFFKFDPNSECIPSVNVNNRRLKLEFLPIIENGHFIVSFNQKYSTFRSLKLYHEYNANSQKLLISSVKNVIYYTLGSDKVIKNGIEHKVSVPLTFRDGLATFAIDEMCELLEIPYTISENRIEINV